MYMCTCISISMFISYKTRGSFVFNLYQLFSYCCEMATVDKSLCFKMLWEDIFGFYQLYSVKCHLNIPDSNTWSPAWKLLLCPQCSPMVSNILLLLDSWWLDSNFQTHKTKHYRLFKCWALLSILKIQLMPIIWTLLIFLIICPVGNS